MASTPISLVRISRPPLLDVDDRHAAADYSMKGLRPDFCMYSMRAASTGSSGGAKGPRLSITTTDSASPAHRRLPRSSDWRPGWRCRGGRKRSSSSVRDPSWISRGSEFSLELFADQLVDAPHRLEEVHNEGAPWSARISGKATSATASDTQGCWAQACLGAYRTACG